ncbi:hypothetical protein NPJ88_006615 [Halomonas elongata]|uniref:hypothetical protein n=1 Tax=Halomonas elongata TaxID=2746 RepID=UPI00255B2ADD|nr:hypothetical protein [Halomonas elongata]MDL4861999.1 hypothetical protein [Halomonas elongata]
MRNELERRLERLEQRHNPSQAMAIIITPIGGDKATLEAWRYSCDATGDEWHRADDETVHDFIARVESDAEALAGADGRPSAMMVAPDLGD